jgi:phosphatidylglycerol:prolipoprotein diacylglycerol transferase
MLYLSHRLRRPGVLMLVYLFGYVITQFSLFFVRANTVVTFLGLDWGLKQAQWTSLIVFILLIPLTFLVFRFSKPVPEGEIPATYGITQKPGTVEQKPALEEAKDQEASDTPMDEHATAEGAVAAEDQHSLSEETEEKIEK